MFARSWRCGAASPDEAIALVRESLTRIRELHDKFAFVYALVPLAAAAVLKGDDAWAARILGARDAVTDRTGVTVVDKSVAGPERAGGTGRACTPRRGSLGGGVRGRPPSSIDALLKDIDRAGREAPHTFRPLARRAPPDQVAAADHPVRTFFSTPATPSPSPSGTRDRDRVARPPC